MNAPDMGGVGQGEAKNVPQRVVVHPRRNGGHQHHRQTRGLAIFDGPELCPRQSRPPQGLIDFVVQPVKLEEHYADPGFCQMLRIADFLCDTNTIGIELKEGKALFLSQRDDFVQILQQGRLAAGKLDVEGAAVFHEKVVLLPDLLQGQVMGLLLPCAGKAHRAA